nr:hypothetical protein [Tanacetum cinerariifolium]
MLAPKGPTFNGRPTFANPMYLKKDQSEKPCLYEIPNDHFDPTNRLVLDKEETLTLAEENSLKSQLETQKTQFLNEIDRLSREYYYADHMNAILGVYTELDEEALPPGRERDWIATVGGFAARQDHNESVRTNLEEEASLSKLR